MRDEQMLSGSAGKANSGGGEGSPFAQMLASMQSEAGSMTELPGGFTMAAVGEDLPLTELLKAIGELAGEAEEVPAPIGELLLSSTSQKAVPLVEALAALQALIQQQSGTVDGEKGTSVVVAAGDMAVLPEAHVEQAEGEDEKTADVVGAEVSLLLPSAPAPSAPDAVGLAAGAVEEGSVTKAAVTLGEPAAVAASAAPTAKKIGAQPSASPVPQVQVGSDSGKPVVDSDPVVTQLQSNVSSDLTKSSGRMVEAQTWQQVNPSPVAEKGAATTATAFGEQMSRQTTDAQSEPSSAFGPATVTSATATSSVTSARVEMVSAPQNAPVVEQIVSAVELINRRGESEVRLRLHPRSLGQVLIQVSTSRGDVSIHMMAETPMGQSVIQDNLVQLREAFSAQGLNVDGLTVTVGNDPSAFDAPAHQQGHEFQSSMAHVTGKSVEDEHSSADSRSTSGRLRGVHTVDYHV
jgi:flagellar hook-length control protein FliK